MIAWIIGGTTGVGREISIALAKRNVNIALIGHHEMDVGVSVSSLKTEYGGLHIGLSVDLNSHQCISKIMTLIDDLGMPDEVYYVAGFNSKIDTIPFSAQNSNAIWQVNFGSAITIMESLIAVNLNNEHKIRFVLFSSIANIRPRNQNIVYSIAKSALETYANNIYFSQIINKPDILVVRLGYIDTFSAEKSLVRILSYEPKKVAKKIINSKKIGVVTMPPYWNILAIFIRVLPKFIWKRITRRLDTGS